MDKPEWCFDSGGNPYPATCKQITMFPDIWVFCPACNHSSVVPGGIGDMAQCQNPTCMVTGMIRQNGRDGICYLKRTQL